jgi:hypothetical protein
MLVLLISILFSSCSARPRGFVYLPELNLLERGLTIDESLESIGRKPLEEIEFDYEGRNILCLMYSADYDQYLTEKSSSQYNGLFDTKSKNNPIYKGIEPDFFRKGKKTELRYVLRPMMLLFVDDKLFDMFWVADINKHEDEYIRELSPLIVEKYKILKRYK